MAPVKRQRPSPSTGQSSSSSSSFAIPRASKRQRRLFTGLTFHIIPAKLATDYIQDLVDLIETNGGRMIDADRADIVVTTIGMRARLERHVPWLVAQEKAVVLPSWVEKSIKSGKRLIFSDHLAIKELQPHDPQAKRLLTPPPPYSAEGDAIPVHSPELAPSLPPDPHYVPGNMPRYSIERKSPLVCPNHELVMQLACIRRARLMDSEERSALSYSRAIAALKAYPNPIKSTKQVADLPFIGPKTILKIGEYLKNGIIAETDTIRKSQYYTTMVDFTALYGVGPSRARQLYEQGFRTYEDLEAHFGTNPDPDDPRATGIAVTLAWRKDLAIKIARAEVEEITRLVKVELDKILPDCEYTIVGGYRRGKSESNDADIVFTNPPGTSHQGVLEKLVKNLHKAGMVTNILPASSFHDPSTLKTYTGELIVERILTVFKLPEDAPSFPNNPSGQKRVRRRLDLLFAPRDVYWCTVIGWTGSMMFERDLRLWCKHKKGLKFDSAGLSRRRDMSKIVVKSEEHLFQLLGVPYLEPCWRNCDA